MLSSPLHRSARAAIVALAIGPASCTPPVAQAAPQPPPRSTSAASSTFAAEVRDSASALGLVGAAAVAARDGSIVAEATYGFSDLAAHRAVDADTLWHWASITKLFTTVAILQLRDRGLLSLDDRATKYLPELRAMHAEAGSADAITIRHLLTHQSGMRDATWPWRDPEKTWQPFAPAGWSQLAAMMPYSELEFAPGAKTSYSNIAFSVLGRIVELLTNDPFVSYVDKNILRPLGMTRSYFDTTPPYLLEHRSKAYERVKGEWKIAPWDFHAGAETANGGLNGPLDDMARFLGFLCPVTPRSPVHELVLAAPSLAEMRQESGALPWGGDLHLGLGAMLMTSHGGRPLVGHTGQQSEFTSTAWCDPKSSWAAIVVTNSSPSESASPERSFHREGLRAAERLFFPPVGR
jgi:CubicO group peptidase (beta-lactamase class C family)